MSKLSNYCLIGITDHQGVMNVGGRLGAAGGPAAFRAQFRKMRGKHPVQSLVRDLGDVIATSSDVRVTHEQAAERVAQAHAAPGCISVVVGGGHDHGYSHLLGLSRAVKTLHPDWTLGCINIDAHLDVRKPPSPDRITSGSPFYLALESGIITGESFIEFGIQSHCNGTELWDYVDSKGVRVVPFEDLRHNRGATVFSSLLAFLSQKCDLIAISFDLDAVAAGHAPGVSAPQSEGFSPSDAIEMMEIAGRHPKVISLGIFELNPLHDEGERTAKLAATSAYHFLDHKRLASLRI